MSNHAAIFRQVFETDPQWLEQVRRGVEKESLRVTADYAKQRFDSSDTARLKVAS